MCDGELVRRAQVGDREAFGALVTRYQGRIYGLCYGMTGYAPDAEDLTHDAFVDAYLKLSQVRHPEKFGPWLRTLALNLCRMWHRNRTRDRTGGMDALPGADADEEALLGRMAGGLCRLSASHRLALALHYWEGLSYEEMATFLDVPVGTVMSRLYRARIALRETMEEMMDSGDMPMASDQDFRREVDAEIDLLLKMSGNPHKRAERLSVLLARSPERFAELVRDAEDEETLQNLALVLRQWGSYWMGVSSSAMGMLLDGYFSDDAVLHTRSEDVLRRWAARCRPGPLRDDHVFLDLLIAHPADVQAKAALLLDLMEAGESAETVTLFTNVLLCHPDAAFPLLMARFWEMSDAEELHGISQVLYALSRMGVCFCEALLDPLAGSDVRRLSLALAGMEAIARAIDPPWLEDAPPEHRMLELRFRGKFAPLWGAHLKASVLGEPVLQEATERVAALVAHRRADVRDTAIRILGLLKAEVFADRIGDCVAHEDASTRVAAVRALADIGDAGCSDALIAASRGDTPQERRAAVETLGRLRVADAHQRCVELIGDADAGVRQAAVIALGELGGEEAQAVLRGLIGSDDKKLARAAASALYGGRKRGRPQSEATRERLRRVRGEDARPFLHISPLAVIWSLPEARPYEERELTRLIARVCGDYSTTRRHLVMEGRNSLMVREKGIYTLTELGQAVWRVERFIRARYLDGSSADERGNGK